MKKKDGYPKREGETTCVRGEALEKSSEELCDEAERIIGKFKNGETGVPAREFLAKIKVKKTEK